MGWEAALRSVLAPDPDLLRYVSDPIRARFVDLLPLGPHADALEIGPGLGQMTQVLAQRSRSVCALEVVPGQAQFVAQRFAQQGLHQVRVATGGDDGRLPYPDRRFDVAVLNLVFEWCAPRCVQQPEIDVQRRLLAEIARVLAPGGTLYLSTKNRYAIKYLIGKTDEHFHGMRFGNALPRPLGRWLPRRRGHERPGGVLYSHRALAALLRDAGFSDLRSYWASPEVRYPAPYVATDAASVREARRHPGFVQGEGRSTRLLMRCIPAALVKHVTTGLTFLASKDT